MLCDYEGCNQDAKHPKHRQKGPKEGEVWCTLCDEHDNDFNEVTEHLGPNKARRLLKLWVKCNGGSKKLAKKMRET